MYNLNEFSGLLPENNPALRILRNCDMGIPFHNQRVINEELDKEEYCIVSKKELDTILEKLQYYKKYYNDNNK